MAYFISPWFGKHGYINDIVLYARNVIKKYLSVKTMRREADLIEVTLGNYLDVQSLFYVNKLTRSIGLKIKQ